MITTRNALQPNRRARRAMRRIVRPIDADRPFSKHGQPRAADRWCMDCDLNGTEFNCPKCGQETMHIAARERGLDMVAARQIMGIGTDELIVDLFAGGGGASTGIHWATGRQPDIGVNHDIGAIEMHADNHPQTRHFHESVWDIYPEDVCYGHKVGLVHASPDCTHFSVAKGGTPVEKDIRGLANVTGRWARYGARIITLENVKEFLTWGPLRVIIGEDGRAMRNEEGDFLWEPIPERKGEYFRKWRKSIERLGYTFGFKIIVAADYGSPTIRKRLFMCFRNDGQPIRFPKATHGPGLPNPWRSAAECIDFRDQGYSIFLTKKQAAKIKDSDGDRVGIKRPLADATLSRTARGIIERVLGGDAYLVDPGTGERVLAPFVSAAQHGGSTRPVTEPIHTIAASTKDQNQVVAPTILNLTHGGRTEDVGVPLKTITGANRGEKALVAPAIVGVGSRAAQSGPRNPSDPLLTVKAKNDAAVAATVVLKAYTTEYDNADVRDPLPTITKQDHNQVASVFIHQHNEGDRTRGVDQPIVTITSGGKQKRPGGNAHGLGTVAVSLLQQQGKSVGATVEAPLNTHTGVNHHQLATAGIIHMGNGEKEGQNPRHEDITLPLNTITAQGKKAALSLVKLRGTARNGDTLDKPIGTIAAQGQHEALSCVELVSYYSTGNFARVSDPVETITSKDRLALVQVKLDDDIRVAVRTGKFLMKYGKVDQKPRGKRRPQPEDYVTWINVEGMKGPQPVFFLDQNGITGLLGDILLRMLRDRELALCQGFGPDYLLTDNSTNNVARIGNSVCPQAAQAWVGAQIGTWETDGEYYEEENLFELMGVA